MTSEHIAQISFDSPPTILAYQNMIESVYHDIINNTILYKQSTIYPVVKIESIIRVDATQIKIIDNGMRIPKEQISEIFKPVKRIAIDVEDVGLGLNAST